MSFYKSYKFWQIRFRAFPEQSAQKKNQNQNQNSREKNLLDGALDT